jgi:hypothetical protein
VARYVEGVDQQQVTLLPECLEDYIAEDNTVRVVKAFVEELDLAAPGFARAAPAGTGRLAPDFKTIADFRRDSGPAIRKVCSRFIVLCRQLNLFTQAVVAIDGSKFKAVNSRDYNCTPGKIDRRIEQVEQSTFTATWNRWRRQTEPSRWRHRPRASAWARISSGCVSAYVSSGK